MTIPTWLRPLENRALLALVLFTATAVFGYWNFGLHPERLTAGFAVAVYQVSFPVFARVQVGLAALVLAVALTRHAGLRWIPALVLVYLLSFAAEHVGTGTGFPFSGYAYTGLLGPRVLDRVPAVIPLSWFTMAAPAWILARATFPSARVARVVTGTFLLVLWDLALDPAMSFLTPYWVWETPGAFYGMPWVNLLGWFGTGLVLLTVLELLDRPLRWSGSLPASWALAYYLVVLAMPLGMVVAGGLWGAAAVTVLALGLWAALAVWKGAPARMSSAVDPPHQERPALATSAAGAP